MEGSLEEVLQFSALLKMVSLAQRKWLDLAQYEGQLIYRQVPLPTFLNLVVPNDQLLLERYPFVTASQVLLSTPTEHLSVSDAFGDLMADAPLPALAAVEDDDDFGDMQGAHEQEAAEHVDDFGNFEGDIAAPIGGLTDPQPFSSPVDAPIQEHVAPVATPVDNEDFGDFSGTAHDVPAVESFGDFEGTEVAPSDPVSSAFDEIQPVQGQPLAPTMNATAPDGDDGFGGFEGTYKITPEDPISSGFGEIQPVQDRALSWLEAPPAAAYGDFEGTAALSADPLSSAFDGIQPVQDEPLPTLDIVAAHLDDDFGEFEGTAEKTTEIPATSSDPFSSAFDEIQPVQDQPLPSLAVAVAPAHADGDFGDFGDFEDSDDATNDATTNAGDPLSSAFNEIQPIQDQPLPSLAVAVAPAHADGDFGDLEGSDDAMNDATTNAGDPLSAAAFNEIQPIQDQPLPSLAVAVAPADDDDFGDFEGTADAANEATTNTADPLSSAFDEIQPIQDQPLPSLAVAVAPAHAADDDDFGDFEGTADATNEATSTSDDPLSSAFDEIQPIQDQPLPSLGSTTTPTPADDNDDFGDFEGTTDATKRTPFAPDPPSSAFDELQSVQDQPCPSLDAAVPRVQAELDDFGASEGTPDAANKSPAHASDPLSLAFDDIQPVQNQSLPPLACIGTLTQPAGDDDFDAFEGTGVPTKTADPIASALSSHERPAPDLPASRVSDPDQTVSEDDFGGVAPLQPVASHGHDPVEVLSTLDIGSSFKQPAAAQQGGGEDADPFSLFNTMGEGQSDRQLAPLSSYSFDWQGNQFLPEESVDESFGDFKTPTGVFTPTPGVASIPPSAYGDITSGMDMDDFGDFKTPDESETPMEADEPTNLLNLEAAFAGQTKATQEDDESDFGDFEGVQEPSDANQTPSGDEVGDFEGVEAPLTSGDVAQRADDLVSDFSSFGVATSSATHNLFDGPESRPVSSAQDEFGALGGAPAATAEAESGEENDDWGDFEHVQLPASTAEPTDDDFADFAAAPTPAHDDFAKFAAAPAPPTEFATSDSAPPPNSDGDRAHGVHPTSSFDANFGSFDNGEAAPDAKKAAQDGDEFGDWDSFQDAPSNNTPSSQEPPQNLDEILDRLQRLTLPGQFSKIDVAMMLQKNVMSTNWASGFGGNSSSSLQRAKRCYELVSLLSTSCSNLVSLDWNRVVTVVRDELTMGSFLLQEAKGLSKESKKEVQKPLSTMVSGLSEFVRVVRSITATIGDILCLDLQATLSTENLESTWQSLDVVKLALEVEESWKAIASVSRILKLTVSTPFESIQAVRKQAIQAESSSLCQLTLQPLSHVENTKNEVIWEGKPFMACAANLWSNRVSNTVP